MGETTEEAIRFFKVNHPPNNRQVLAYPLIILKAVKVGITFTLWRLFPRLDENRAVECELHHQMAYGSSSRGEGPS